MPKDKKREERRRAARIRRAHSEAREESQQEENQLPRRAGKVFPKIPWHDPHNKELWRHFSRLPGRSESE